jgi:hypothetical protein
MVNEVVVRFYSVSKNGQIRTKTDKGKKMGTLFKIKPLAWTDCTRGGCAWFSADTPFGSYNVEQDEDGTICWRWCFDEYYDEGKESCESIEEGKDKAWAHWLKRIAPALEEVHTAR